MKWFQFSMLLVIAFVAGCSRGGKPNTTQEEPPAATSQKSIPDKNPPNAGKLSDIGEPDSKTRKVGEILIVGSALTDDHVAAIRAMTDAKAPKNSKKDLIRNIQHTSPNRALNIWQGSHFESYQALVLVDGVWEFEETGGGFGTFR